VSLIVIQWQYWWLLYWWPVVTMYCWWNYPILTYCIIVNWSSNDILIVCYYCELLLYYCVCLLLWRPVADYLLFRPMCDCDIVLLLFMIVVVVILTKVTLRACVDHCWWWRYFIDGLEWPEWPLLFLVLLTVFHYYYCCGKRISIVLLVILLYWLLCIVPLK
jgi:hypothetical protein